MPIPAVMPRLNVCVPNDYQSHTTRWAKCAVHMVAAYRHLHNGSQGWWWRPESCWWCWLWTLGVIMDEKGWTHEHCTKGVSWALTAVENFKGFVDSRRIAATFNDLGKWQVSLLSQKPSHSGIATYNDCLIRLVLVLSQWQQVPVPSQHLKSPLFP